MVWLGIKKLAGELPLQKTGPEASGYYGNIFVVLADRTGMKTVEIRFPEFSDEDKETLAEIFEKLQIKEYHFGDKSVLLIFREHFLPYSIQKIKLYIDSVREYYSGKYPHVKPVCHQCNEPKEARVYYTREGSLCLCEDCFYKYKNNIEEEEYQKTHEPGNYLRGFAGALLYSLPGILVTLVFFNVLKTLAAVSAVVYIFLAQRGYKKFGGKQNIAGSMIVNLSGVLMTIFGIIVSYTVLIFTKVKSIELVTEMFRNAAVKRELLANIVMALMVSLVYVAINTLQMNTAWSKAFIKEGKNIR